MESENVYRQEIIDRYCAKMNQIFRYIPWFQKKLGINLSKLYEGADMPERSVPIPVYDSMILSFVKEMQATGLLNRNYVYVYSRYHIRTEADELRFIKEAELQNLEEIFGIISKYVLGGMTKGRLWLTAVENGVFYHSLIKIKELLEIWDAPLA